jgi:hypothetical protein
VILAIDPGPTESAFVFFDRTPNPFGSAWKEERFGKHPNGYVLDMLKTKGKYGQHDDRLAIEMIASYGMPVGREVFETCVWIGRFVEAWDRPYEFVYRKDVKLHLCGQARAKDANIRQALIDRFGPIGTKKQPGVLYGVKSDIWSALAVAVTYADMGVS